MKKYNYLLLDLDGTLVDPFVGITGSVAYALKSFGIEIEDLKELCPFIGPPLLDSFQEFYSFTEEQAREAVAKYRERYVEKGVYENDLYEGIEEFLSKAKQAGGKLMLATAKPTPYAEKILDYFNLTPYFDFIGGSTLDGTRHTKTDVICHVLESNLIEDLSTVIMIGDRKHDIIGAKETGIDSIGVLYGYGSYEELSEAKANYIVENIQQLGELLI